MTHIKIRKGLDIPIKGSPEEPIQELSSSPVVGLDYSPYPYLRLRLNIKSGDKISAGQLVAEDKVVAGRCFVSPISGTVREIRRGVKRSLDSILIEADGKKTDIASSSSSLDASSKEELVQTLARAGLLIHIHSRPFHLMANPQRLPRAIFIKALESAPFVPPAEMQVEGYEEEFAFGIKVLNRIAEENVHLIMRKGSSCSSFSQAQNVQIHTAEGPHPISNPSLHIQMIDPIRSAEEMVWTLDVNGVICLGAYFLKGTYHHQKVISLSGPCMDRLGFFRTEMGSSIDHLVGLSVQKENVRLISGDPLTGKKVGREDFLGHFHSCVCAFEEGVERETFHFLRLGIRKYTASGAYPSRLFGRSFDFNTLKHGEVRAFVDGSVYDKVMPMKIPVMHLIKAVLSGDFEMAKELGILEVAPEDFSLSTFICPSKIEMVDIVEQGLKKFAEELILLS